MGPYSLILDISRFFKASAMIELSLFEPLGKSVDSNGIDDGCQREPPA